MALEFEQVFREASEARTAFEQGIIPRALLAGLLESYAPGFFPKMEMTLRRAQEQFPKNNCVIASLYMQHKLGEGIIREGAFGDQFHATLKLDIFPLGRSILDITSDQFAGGQPIYIGPVRKPWS